MALPPPLTVIKITKYCGVTGGGALRATKSYKNDSVPRLCHYDSKVFWNLWGGGGGAKILQNDNGAPLSVIKIVKYCGQKYDAHKLYNCILPVTN